jgi:peptidoglycan/xylan/chitin deacetylase (PgdA/CDA1 family)
MWSAVMQGKKQLLASLLTYSRITNLFSKYPLHNKLLVLNYHRIKDDDQDFSTLFDDGVFSTDVQSFTDQMLWLKDNSTVLGQQEFMDMMRHNGSSRDSKPYVMVTFDDGYRDNYTVAYPILTMLEIPATFFLTTSMLTHRELPWWDIISYLFKNTSVKKIHYNDRVFDLHAERNEAIQHFLVLKKTQPAAATRYLTMELSELLQVDPPDAEAQSAEIMTWEQVREMRAGGMEFGSHTHTHRVLTTLDPMEIREELLLSKLLMERELNEEVLSISYPVGETKLVPEGIGDLCRECGYRIGYTTNSGVNSWDNLETFSIRRTAYLLESVSTVSLMTLFPEIFLWESKKTRKLEPDLTF